MTIPTETPSQSSQSARRRVDAIELAKAADLDTAEECDRASRRRVGTYLLLPARDRLGHIHDPYLNEVDRDRLLKSIHGALPANYSKTKGQKLTMKKIRALMIRNAIATAILFIAAGLIGFIAFETYVNTGRLVAFRQAVTVAIPMPNGSTQQIVLAPNTAIAAVGSGDGTRLRFWFKRWGYAFSPTPREQR